MATPMPPIKHKMYAIFKYGLTKPVPASVFGLGELKGYPTTQNKPPFVVIVYEQELTTSNTDCKSPNLLRTGFSLNIRESSPDSSAAEQRFRKPSPLLL